MISFQARKPGEEEGCSHNYLIPVPQGDKTPETGGNHLLSGRVRYLKAQSPVSRLPYLEVRKQGMGLGNQEAHECPSLPVYYQLKHGAWAHIDPWDPHGTMSLKLTCVGGTL